MTPRRRKRRRPRPWRLRRSQRTPPGEPATGSAAPAPGRPRKPRARSGRRRRRPEHRRAPARGASVARAKSWGGLSGFVLGGYLSLPTNTFAEAMLRALVAGVVCYMVTWAGAVFVWRRLVVIEIKGREAAARAGGAGCARAIPPAASSARTRGRPASQGATPWTRFTRSRPARLRSAAPTRSRPAARAVSSERDRPPGAPDQEQRRKPRTGRAGRGRRRAPAHRRARLNRC